jgi:polyhydroxybutyrate depolymerase
VEEVLTGWVAHNGCSPEPEAADLTPSISRRVHRQCKGGASVEFYFIVGGGHTWPGSKLLTTAEASNPNRNRNGGDTTTDIDATELSWAFFQRHALTP